MQVAHELLELLARDARAVGIVGRGQAPAAAQLALGVGVDLLARGAGRVGGHDAAVLGGDPRVAAAVDGLALLPQRQHRTGDEDRRVRARDRADEQRERERLQRLAAEQQQREHRQAGAEARRQGAHDDLGHGAVDDLREGRPRHARDVLADSVEHDDRVVQREPKDGEQRRDRRRCHLLADERVHARSDEDVVHDGDQHRDGVLGLESQRDVRRDHEQRRDDRDDRRVGDRLAERRSDRGRARACRRGRTSPRARW